jgi:hypothetical protein
MRNAFNHFKLHNGGTAMRRFWFVVFVLSSLVISTQAFSQSSNASISGTVADATGGVLPGVAITATNTATGIVTKATTNSAGIYSFQSIQPGTYKVSAEMKGFQTRTFTDVQVGNAAQIRLNFGLDVGQLSETVEVSVAGDRLLLESSSSVGDVLPETKVRELPLTSQNVLDLSKVMGGVIQTNDAIFGEGMGLGGGGTTFAGVSPAMVNVQRDGIPMSDVRWPTGINSATRLNPDLVGEVRMVLAPVDAEAGRGNGQVQVQTKSGTNAYHGAAAFNAQNSFLDPNTWANNRSGIAAPWRNLEQYTLSVGGPIIKNKTFFFALWDQQFARQRYPRQSLALTPCAQRGIFRYYDNWSNGNVFQTTTGGSTPTVRVVNADGTPTAQYIPYLDPNNPNSGPHNGILRYASVFGPLASTPKQADCSDAVVTGAPYDNYRTGMDPTGYIANFIKMTPKVNNYEVGDGLNTAGSRWNQTIRGADNLYGVGEDTQRKQINVRIDHNFNQKHRVNGSWSYERDWADDTFANWPENSYGGKVVRRPQVFTVNLISTFTPTLLNEARVGMMRTGSNILSPLWNPDVKDKMIALLPKVNGQPMIIGPGDTNVNFSPDCFPYCPPNAAAGTPSNPFGGRGMLSYDGFDESPRWTYGDTLAWTRGSHSFKFGGEYRSSGSYGAVGWVMNASFQSLVPTPFAAGGASPYSPNGITPFTGIPGLAGFYSGNQQNMASLLNFLSGSIASMRQYYFLNTPTQTTWSDYTKEPYPIRDFHQNEWGFFFKDDWKVRSDLTLNLGLRWDYYGVPYVKSGMTAGMEGGGAALYSISGRSWEEAFWKPGQRANLTKSIFVGPNSPNEGQSVYERDSNNFGPAIGFAWQLPWFGKGKTTIRGGYQVSYMPSARVSTIADTLGTPPGSTYMASYSGDAVTRPYLNMQTLVSPVPIPAGISPMTPIPVTDRSMTISAFDPHFRNPYIQNLTLAITRNITSNLEVDVKYIGTLSRKMMGTTNINAPNFMTNGLLQAFNAARAGRESALLDDLLYPVRGSMSGAEFLRNPAGGGMQMAYQVGVYSFVMNDLANGNYANLANAINYLGSKPGDWLRGSGHYPENFIKTNPQFNNANYLTNSDTANYHSLQTQATLRPTHGISFTATYTWSKNLGFTGTMTDPLDRHGDYTVLPGNRSHVFVTYGTFDLPFGPGRKIGSSSTGVVARLIEQWQGSWILNIRSGTPLNITAQNMLYGNGVPDLVGKFDFDAVGVSWAPGASQGNYFNNLYHYVKDPQCSNVAASISSGCTLQAVADSSGNIVFQNPQPGMRGNFGRNRISGPGEWTLDMAISKGVRITESTNFQFRLDANNILNHPVASYGSFGSGMRIIVAQPPAVNINGTDPFGYLNNKVGGRTFQITARLNF